MKVLAAEDVKVVVEEKGESSSKTISYPEYEPKPETNLVNLSKLVLLTLAIIASFLLCLIFARDLWGQKAEKQEVAHPLRQVHLANDGPSNFHFSDDPFESLRDLPLEKDFRKKLDDPKMVSRTTKITLRILPSEQNSEQNHNLLERDGPLSEEPVDDIMKTIMSIFDKVQQPNQLEQKPFLNIPTIFHQQNPVHPKLIIVRKMNPTSSPNSDDGLKNFLDDIIGSSKLANDEPELPFPLFPIQPVHHKSELESDLSKIFPFMKHVVISRKPVVPTASVVTKVDEIPESWKQYKELVSEMAESVDTLLDDTASLKEIVKNSSAITVETTEAPIETAETQQSNSSSKDIPTTQQPSTDIQQSLNDTKYLLNKISDALTETSVLIKTEDAAMDLVNRVDKAGLVLAIDSFMKSIHPSLNDVFDASTILAKPNGNEIPEEIYNGIVKLDKGLIHFGNLVYEKMADLKKSIVSGKSSEVAEFKDLEPKKDTEDKPIIRRRIVIINSKPELENGKLFNF